MASGVGAAGAAGLCGGAVVVPQLALPALCDLGLNELPVPLVRTSERAVATTKATHNAIINGCTAHDYVT
jgi:hypothetical protein